MKEETKRLSLSECKNEIAKKNGFFDWLNLEARFSRSVQEVDKMIAIYYDEAAEMYASQSPLPDSRVKPDKPDFEDLANEMYQDTKGYLAQSCFAGMERIWRDYVEPFGNNEQLQKPTAKWIKSSDQMPEENVSVLVFIPEEDNHITVGMWDVSKKWVLLDEYRVPLSEVTYWAEMIAEPEDKSYTPLRTADKDAIREEDTTTYAIRSLQKQVLELSSPLKDSDEELEELRTYKHVCNESIAHLHRSNEELIEALRDMVNLSQTWGRECFNNDNWQKIVNASDLLHKHSSLVKKQEERWISVNDRLPKNNENVLCFDGTRMRENSYSSYSDQDEQWFKTIFTHWRPLLERPKF
jgi:hypothetical protein